MRSNLDPLVVPVHSTSPNTLCRSFFETAFVLSITVAVLIVLSSLLLTLASVGVVVAIAVAIHAGRRVVATRRREGRSRVVCVPQTDACFEA